MIFTSKAVGYLLCLSLSALISFLFMPQIYSIAKNVRAIDDPKRSERTIHTKKIPRLGGLGIYIGFLLVYSIVGHWVLNSNYDPIWASRMAEQMESVLIGSFFIVLMGIFDDISPVRAWKKFIIQIIAASIVVFRGDFIVGDFDLVFINIVFPKYVSEIFTVLWIVMITNAINFSDGMDGLAGGLSFISLITMAIIGIMDTGQGQYAVVVIMISLILSGSILGFMPYNLPPAKIFMGDSGAQFIGFMIGAISVLGYKQAAFTSFFIPIIILAIPIFDTVFAFFRRTIKRIPASAADANHVHHRVLQNTESQKETLFWIYGMSILFSTSAVVYSQSKEIGTVVFIVAFIASELFIEYFHIVRVRYTPLINLFCQIFPNTTRDKKRRQQIMKTLRYQNIQKKQVEREMITKKQKKHK